MLYPRLSANELHICHLVKTGIPVSQIAHLLNRSTSAITVARARMHKKLTGEEGSAEKTDKIILDL
jgi:DNA-binding CsgD family transcriptional regulator